MAATAGASSAAAAKWVIHGRGFGHGVGMSQYGAYGYAKHGRDYKSILKHYYRHTRIGNADGSVKVLLASPLEPHAASDVVAVSATTPPGRATPRWP